MRTIATGNGSWTHSHPAYGPNTYSYGLMNMIVAFTPAKRGVIEEEAKAWAEDLRRLGKEGSYFFSLNRYLFLAIKGGNA